MDMLSNSEAIGKSTLPLKLLFFVELYELEEPSSHHTQPVVIGFGNDATEIHEDCKRNTSSRKRAQTTQLQIIRDYVDNH